jgi:uncharacterized protein
MTTSPPAALVVNLAGLLGEPAGARRDIAVDGVWLELGDDLRQAAPLALEARIARTNRGVFVTGTVRTSLADTCGRCLVTLEIPLEATLEEEVLPTIELSSGARVDTSAEPEAFRLTDHHELDLEPLAREAVELAAPIAPVCRPDCRGLCPECGVDRNVGPHEHVAAAVDPRLEKLGELLPDE